MSQQVFHPGQRWVSHSESELGLGMVEALEGRHVTIFYPAVEETRIYAFSNAPLSRVIYNVDDSVRHNNGDVLTINETQEHNHCICLLYTSPSPRDRG